MVSAYAPPESVVPEYASAGAREPDPSDPRAAAAFWMKVNGDRFEQATAIERSHGLAVCDTDPLKLHYSWCLARCGAAPWDRFRVQAALARQMFEQGRLGLADAVLLGEAPPTELRLRRAQDSGRRRGNFDLHLRLVEPLREWYAAWEALDAESRVRWALPAGGLPADLPAPRPTRTDPMLLDRLLSGLPEI